MYVVKEKLDNLQGQNMFLKFNLNIFDYLEPLTP